MLKPKATSERDALNPSQSRIVTHGAVPSDAGVASPPLIVLAGAGTGKTHALAHRVAHLVLNGVDPVRILSVNFTQRAARAMAERAQTVVSQLLAERGKLPDRSVQSRLQWCGTFHSLANRVLRLYASQLGLDPAFTLLGRADAANVMAVVHHELGVADKDKRFPGRDTCLWLYGQRIQSRLSLKQTLAEQLPAAVGWEADLARLFREYVARKQKYNALDIDDLLLYWHAMMQNPTLAAHLSGNFDHVLVDDYQDTSVLQAEIIQSLRPDGRGVILAADDAQAIFPPRSRRFEQIPRLANRYTPKAEVIVLTQNYRSSLPMLDCANALLADGLRQYRKTLFSTRQSSHKPVYVTVDDEDVQAEYITGRILASRENGGSLRRHAILFRSQRHAAALERELGRRNVPYVTLGTTSFLEAGHVRDMLAVLRWVDNPRNTVAGFRALKLVPGIDPRLAKAVLEHFAAQACSFASLAGFEAPKANAKDWKAFCTLLETLTEVEKPWAGQVRLVRDWYKPQMERLYEDAFSRVRGLDLLEQLGAQYASRERFLTELTLDPPTPVSDQAAATAATATAANDEEYVVLSTIQAAVGQEWDIVYLMNACDGNLPSEPAGGNAELIEEERRLLYVAMTRARQELHLCVPQNYSATSRAGSGDQRPFGGTSRFLAEKVTTGCERVTYRSSRGLDGLRTGETARVDVASQLKEMW